VIIASVASGLLRLPLPRPMSSGSSGNAGGKPLTPISMPLVIIMIENGVSGLESTLILMGDILALQRALAVCREANTTHDVQPGAISVGMTTDGQSVMSPADVLSPEQPAHVSSSASTDALQRSAASFSPDVDCIVMKSFAPSSGVL